MVEKNKMLKRRIQLKEEDNGERWKVKVYKTGKIIFGLVLHGEISTLTIQKRLWISLLQALTVNPQITTLSLITDVHTKIPFYIRIGFNHELKSGKITNFFSKDESKRREFLIEEIKEVSKSSKVWFIDK
jgi:hypothetical protein